MATYSNTSLQRGMAILGVLGESAEPQTLTEIATAVGLARSTTFRLLAVLQDLDFVLKNSGDGTYSLGFNAYRLGQTAHAVEAIVRDARPFIRKLAYDLGLTTYLGALEGSQILICHVIEPPDAIKSPVSERMRIDAHAVSCGKALLATRRADEVAAYFSAHPLRRYTGKTLTGYESLRQELLNVARRGHASEHGELREGIESLAVAVPSHLDRPILALTTVGTIPPQSSSRFRNRLEKMRATVAEIQEYRRFGRTSGQTERLTGLSSGKARAGP
jgi:DNA-binding IclR family transcriptional regulator